MAINIPRPIEIKSALSYSPALYRNVLSFAEMEPGAAPSVLIYGGKDMGTLQGVKILSFAQAATLSQAGNNGKY